MKLMKISLTFFVLLLSARNSLIAQYATTSKFNYVRQWQMKAPVTDPLLVADRPVEEAATTTQYIDGLGRSVQAVSKQSSPLRKDVVAMNVYDDYGREVYKYLPFVSTQTGAGNGFTDDGNLKMNPIQQQQLFMSNFYAAQGETFFYGRSDYESSPLEKSQRSFAAGNSWVGSRG